MSVDINFVNANTIGYFESNINQSEKKYNLKMCEHQFLFNQYFDMVKYSFKLEGLNESGVTS